MLHNYFIILTFCSGVAYCHFIHDIIWGTAFPLRMSIASFATVSSWSAVPIVSLQQYHRVKFAYLHCRRRYIECRGQVVNSPLYLGGASFESWPRQAAILIEVFRDFPQSLQVNFGIVAACKLIACVRYCVFQSHLTA
jgi:hypothetical protein